MVALSTAHHSFIHSSVSQDDGDADKAQSGVVSAATLTSLLDRGHLAQGTAAPYPPSGVGYEVVKAADSSTLLQGVN